MADCAPDKVQAGAGFLGDMRRRLSPGSSRKELEALKAQDKARAEEMDALRRQLQERTDRERQDTEVVQQHVSGLDVTANIRSGMKAINRLLAKQRQVDLLYYEIVKLRELQCEGSTDNLLEGKETVNLTPEQEDKLKSLIAKYQTGATAYNVTLAKEVEEINTAHRAIANKCNELKGSEVEDVTLRELKYGPPLTETYTSSIDADRNVTAFNVYGDEDVADETLAINAFYTKLSDEIAALAAVSRDDTSSDTYKQMKKDAYEYKTKIYRALQEGLFTGVGIELVKHYPSLARYNRLAQETRHISIMYGQYPNVVAGTIQPPIDLQQQPSLGAMAGGAKYAPAETIGFLELMGSWLTEKVEHGSDIRLSEGAWFKALRSTDGESDKFSCDTWIAGAVPFFKMWNDLQAARLATGDKELTVKIAEWNERENTVVENPSRPMTDVPKEPAARKEFLRQKSKPVVKKAEDDDDCSCELMWNAINAIEKKAGVPLSGPFAEMKTRSKGGVKESDREGVYDDPSFENGPYSMPAADLSRSISTIREEEYNGATRGRLSTAQSDLGTSPSGTPIQKVASDSYSVPRNGSLESGDSTASSDIPAAQLSLRSLTPSIMSEGSMPSFGSSRMPSGSVMSEGADAGRLSSLGSSRTPSGSVMSEGADAGRLSSFGTSSDWSLSNGSDGADARLLSGMSDMSSRSEPGTPLTTWDTAPSVDRQMSDSSTGSFKSAAGTLPRPPRSLHALRRSSSSLSGGASKTSFVIGNVALAAVTVAAAFWSAA